MKNTKTTETTVLKKGDGHRLFGGHKYERMENMAENKLLKKLGVKSFEPLGKGGIYAAFRNIYECPCGEQILTVDVGMV
jgi:hypothetical protein